MSPPKPAINEALKLVIVSMYSLALNPAFLYALFAYSITLLLLFLNNVSIPPVNCSYCAYCSIDNFVNTLAIPTPAVTIAADIFAKDATALVATLFNLLLKFSKFPPSFSTSSPVSLASFSSSSKALLVFSICLSMPFISASVEEIVVFILVKALLAFITLFFLVSNALLAFFNSSSSFLTSLLFSPYSCLAFSNACSNVFTFCSCFWYALTALSNVFVHFSCSVLYTDNLSLSFSTTDCCNFNFVLNPSDVFSKSSTPAPAFLKSVCICFISLLILFICCFIVPDFNARLTTNCFSSAMFPLLSLV